jgi:hypothetical protein
MRPCQPGAEARRISPGSEQCQHRINQCDKVAVAGGGGPVADFGQVRTPLLAAIGGRSQDGQRIAGDAPQHLAEPLAGDAQDDGPHACA